jgi:hypothetical protein
VEDFWGKYDWSDESTKVHLQSNQAKEGEEIKLDDSIEWTKEGMEEILSTVGVQCSYETHVSLGSFILSRKC